MADLVFVGTLNRVRFSSDDEDSDFKIATIKVNNILDGKPSYIYNPYSKDNNSKSVLLKGELPLSENVSYIFNCIEDEDPKYGMQYKLESFKRENPVENMDAAAFNKFLPTILGANAQKIIEKFPDSRSIFEEGDIESLMTIDGIGEHRATDYIEAYESQKDYTEAYAAFGEWGFTPLLVQKIIRQVKSVERAIKLLKSNPYTFMEMKGIGFLTIDRKAIQSGISPNDPRRVKAYMENLFNEEASNGNSYIELRDFLVRVSADIFEWNMKQTFEMVKSSDDFTIIETKDGEKRISSKKYSEIERNISLQLIRLLAGKSELNLLEVDTIIKSTEDAQGFSYSKTQREAIDNMLEKNVFILQGLAGTGKSSTVNGFLQVIEKNHYHYVQCALSGKAADNLSQITGKQGSTIHSLLGATKNGFEFNEKKQLRANAFILDEVSMVDLNIANALLKAIPTGSKLIMLGDGGQLDSIGLPYMKPLLESKLIPAQTLTEVHRQALDSAMITHSLDYRKGKIPLEAHLKKQDKVFIETYGVKQDLTYMMMPDDKEEDITKYVMAAFLKETKIRPIKDIQVLCNTIGSGSVNCNILNDQCQRIANPPRGQEEVNLKRSKDEDFVIREGDKVINVQNNRKTLDYQEYLKGRSKALPIYNGNTGIVKTIIHDKLPNGKLNTSMVVAFDGIGEVLIKRGDLRNIQLGYCITVHKSQGSTIQSVIVALPFQFKLNSRELLYTAITRASKNCYLVSSPRTIRATIKKSSSKSFKSNLPHYIRIMLIELSKALKEKGKEGAASAN